jgi:hypothetical protein
MEMATGMVREVRKGPAWPGAGQWPPAVGSTRRDKSFLLSTTGGGKGILRCQCGSLVGRPRPKESVDAGWRSALGGVGAWGHDLGRIAGRRRPRCQWHGGRFWSRVRALPRRWVRRPGQAGRPGMAVRPRGGSRKLGIVLKHLVRVPGARHAVQQGEQERAGHGGVGCVACLGGVPPEPREDAAVNHVRGYPEAFGSHVRLIDISARDCHDLCGVRVGWVCAHEGGSGPGR